MPSSAHLLGFETQAKPAYYFDTFHQEPFVQKRLGAPVFTGKNWRLYQHEGLRGFHIFYSKDQYKGPEYFLTFDPATRRGKIFYKNNASSVEISPLHYRPLGLLLIDIFALRKGIFLHATGIIYKQQSYVFTGFSEAGKSTLARLWMNIPGVEVISDERVLICEQDHQLWAYGTPWKSSAGQSSPSGAPLKKVYIVHHAAANAATPLRPVQASSGMFTHAYPAVWDKQRLSANIDLIEQVVTSIPCYDFGFVPDMSAIDYLLCHS